MVLLPAWVVDTSVGFEYIASEMPPMFLVSGVAVAADAPAPETTLFSAIGCCGDCKSARREFASGTAAFAPTVFAPAVVNAFAARSVLDPGLAEAGLPLSAPSAVAASGCTTARFP